MTKGITRRTFLKTAGAIGAAAALGQSAALATGCRSELGDEVFKGIRKFTDDAGRELTLPTAENLTKVYFTSGLAQIFIMTLAPEKMAATCSKFDAIDMMYLPKEMQGLTYLGAVETGEMDVEAVMQKDVQVIFSISSIELVQSNIDEANDIQDRSGIPVVLIDGSFSKIGDAYTKLGDILGKQERAAKLAKYCQDTEAAVRAAVKDVPEDKKVRFYYAEGPKGLQTEPAESQHAETFMIAGGHDVAQVEFFDATGMSDVSLESVISWNPEVIITWDSDIRGGAYDLICTSADWAVIDAVKNGKVYEMPNIPMAWVDRPMAVNRYLGLHWLANLFYPNLYNVDMVKIGQEFYELFLGVTVSDIEMMSILGTSYMANG